MRQESERHGAGMVPESSEEARNFVLGGERAAHFSSAEVRFVCHYKYADDPLDEQVALCRCGGSNMAEEARGVFGPGLGKDEG